MPLPDRTSSDSSRGCVRLSALSHGSPSRGHLHTGSLEDSETKERDSKKESEKYQDHPGDVERAGVKIIDGDGAGRQTDESSSITLVPMSKENATSWKVLFGCFLIAFTCMGYGMLQGAFQAFYASSPSSPPEIRDNPESVISLVGGLLAFSCTALAGVSGRLGDRYGYKPVIASGMIFGIVSLVTTAFARTLWAVFITQGLLFGLAQALIVPLILSLPSQHFDTHRALATGIVGSAAGWGGGALAIATRVLLTRFGGIEYPLFIFAGGYAVTWGVGLWLLEEVEERKAFVRRKWAERRARRAGAGNGLLGVKEGERSHNVREKRHKRKRWDLNLGGVERSSVFWALWIGVVISTFAYLAPFQYIGTYTTDMLPELEGTFRSAMPLVAMAWGLGLGRIMGGQIADRIGAIQTLVLAFYIAGLFQLVVWHFATTFPGIIGFAVSYGMFGGAALSLIPVVVKQLFPDARDHFAALVGLVMMSTAPGQFAGSAIAGSILSASGGKWISFQVFSGFLQILGGLAASWAWYKGIGLRFGNARRVAKVDGETESAQATGA